MEAKSNPPTLDWNQLPPDERESVLCQIRIKTNEARDFASALENGDSGWHRLARTWEAVLRKLES